VIPLRINILVINAPRFCSVWSLWQVSAENYWCVHDTEWERFNLTALTKSHRIANDSLLHLLQAFFWKKLSWADEIWLVEMLPFYWTPYEGRRRRETLHKPKVGPCPKVKDRGIKIIWKL